VAAGVEIVRLGAGEARSAAGELGEVLADCVAGGASVNFMHPYTAEEGRAFFEGVADEVERGDAALIAAKLDRRFVGTVNLGLRMPPNQPHRAEVRKMLVLRAARGRGIGDALLVEAERWASELGRTLLVLDTVEGMAGERLYARGGWTRVGAIPGYALFPDGEPCATVVFYKSLV
jgi:GNAT superfamily N-acetyltransferase